MLACLGWPMVQLLEVTLSATEVRIALLTAVLIEITSATILMTSLLGVWLLLQVNSNACVWYCLRIDFIAVIEFHDYILEKSNQN